MPSPQRYGRRRPAVFLDKDGTLLRNVPYNVDPHRMELVAGAVPALQSLQQAGFILVVVSNQSGVARGFFGEDDVVRAGDALAEMLRREGVRIDGFYYCPHFAHGIVEEYSVACSCRKPRPGLLAAAARDRALDLTSSWMIGDILDDVEAGNRAGCRTVLVDVGNETEWVAGEHRIPHRVVPSLTEAARFVVAASGGRDTAPKREASA